MMIAAAHLRRGDRLVAFPDVYVAECEVGASVNVNLTDSGLRRTSGNSEPVRRGLLRPVIAAFTREVPALAARNSGRHHSVLLPRDHLVDVIRLASDAALPTPAVSGHLDADSDGAVEALRSALRDPLRYHVSSDSITSSTYLRSTMPTWYTTGSSITSNTYLTAY
jgi:hypothetical protein